MVEIAWAKNGTPNTLGSSGADMDITDLTATKFKVVLTHQLTTGTTDFACNMTFNDDGTTSYADRRSSNGGADATDTSQSSTRHKNGWNEDEFVVDYICDISGEETLRISYIMTLTTNGAGTAPARMEVVSKWDDTSQITRIDINETGSDELDTNSNISVLGTD